MTFMGRTLVVFMHIRRMSVGDMDQHQALLFRVDNIKRIGVENIYYHFYNSNSGSVAIQALRETYIDTFYIYSR